MFRWDLGDGADLRMLELRHAPAFLAFVVANRAYLGPWLGWAYTITTVEDAEAFIQRGVARYAEDGLPWVGLWQDNEMVGGLLFFPLERVPRSTEIGYWLGEGAAGRGLMSRAVRAMLGLAFDELNINRMALQAEVDNARSRALAERLGFSFEGVRRHLWTNQGRLVDMASYAMLAEDWRRLAPASGADGLAEARRLRQAGEHERARGLLVELAAQRPDDAAAHYDAACVHDFLGLEREAVPYYTAAIRLGLSGEDLQGAYLGLGSTYRALGRYDDARATFLEGLERISGAADLQVFLAMARYNLGEHHEAVASLLRVIADTTADAATRRYGRALRFYAEDLDKVWG
jgi:RimJ/RimL family protein N-acetyltransferase